MKYNIIFAVLSFLAFGSCRDVDIIEETENDTELVHALSDYPDWTDETHSNDYAPDYNVVFNQNEVLRFDITISSENWSAMQADLANLLGSSGPGPGGGGPGPGGGEPGPGGGGPGPGGGLQETESDPIWVECTFSFNNIAWYNVGVRYKGNSSLQSAYQNGISKLSFKLDFDEFEDDYPMLEDQRFYGFKQLNLNNNFEDESLMREKVASDLFREIGMVAPQTAFCVVYVDYGSGPKYFGVYTLVEEVDDTVLDSQYTDGSGNLYKPDGDAASFALNTYNDSEMEKKTNEELADYSDVLALYNAINADDMTSNTETWKANLESVFNVDLFMKWLAANTTIQNWDTYGKMTHNYYLYNNPEDDLLTWIPWDNNEAFKDGKQGGALSLEMIEVGDDWPLIRYLLDIPEYKQIYDGYLRQFTENIFTPSEMQARYTSYYNMLKDYAYSEEPGYTFIQNFDQAVEELKTHVQTRNDEVNSYLTQNMY